MEPVAPPPARVLEPEQLLEAGILGDPKNPEDALKRARGLIQQGRFKEARELLTPHLADPIHGTAALELLGDAATKSGSKDAQEVLDRALHRSTEAGDALGRARARRLLGELLLGRGELDSAESFLKSAGRVFSEHGEVAEAAWCQAMRAQARLKSGFANEAQSLIDQALAMLAPLGKPRQEALMRLERARILACRGDANAAARDLLLAERSLGVSGGAPDRLRARIARAETLVWLGEGSRAAAGLLRSLVDVVDIEEVGTVAWVHALLGEALLAAEPAAARRHLSRARHLYENVDHTYDAAACDIQMARVERRLGLNPEGRLAGLGEFGEWPLLAARLEVAKAEIQGEGAADATRMALYKARGFALEHGHRGLALETEQALAASGLTLEQEGEDLTPVDRSNVSPMPEVNTKAPRPIPIPMSLTTSSNDDARQGRASGLFRPQRVARR